MGLELKSPIIVGANNLVTNLDNLKRIEKAGAGAIVYKSIFEEQVQLENLELFERETEYDDRNAEMIRMFPEQINRASDIQNHLTALRKAKESVSIPVIGNILSGLEKWMDLKGYPSLESFRGKLSKKNTDNKLPYHRTQYMDFMMTTSEILKKYKAIN